MPRVTREVCVCDGCRQEIPNGKESVFASGSRLAGVTMCSETILCAACVGKKAGTPVEERIVYVRENDDSPGYGGATGRPFVLSGQVTSSALAATDSWCTLPLSLDCSPACSHGPASSPSASTGPSTLLGRLLTSLTPGT